MYVVQNIKLQKNKKKLILWGQRKKPTKADIAITQKRQTTQHNNDSTKISNKPSAFSSKTNNTINNNNQKYKNKNNKNNM